MTFEDLLAAYRTEMKAALLSDVRSDLYPSLLKLQESIRKDYETEYSKDPDSIMCEGMNERRKKVVIYVQKVIDLRMEKISTMALRTAMGAENTLNKLTPEEREYYGGVVDGSRKLRSLIVKGTRRYTIPDISAGVESTVLESSDARNDTVPVTEDEPKPAENESEEMPHMDEEPQDDMMVIRILEDIPDRIAGPDCDYDLRKEDIIRMPVTLAKALINHEKAAALNVKP